MPVSNPEWVACPKYMPSTPASIPPYLEQHYWWAYVHPNAVQVLEREWLVNLILFGNYGRLRDLALNALGEVVSGRTLQVACVYGNLTARLLARMTRDGALDVVDILPIQLQNLARKIPSDPRMSVIQSDSSALGFANASHDQALLFFLLHEQPDSTRRHTLRETLRVVKPGGRVVIVDYHRPHAWHPLRPLMKRVFSHLEPFAQDLWAQPLEAFLPTDFPPHHIHRTLVWGGLYQVVVLEL